MNQRLKARIVTWWT